MDETSPPAPGGNSLASDQERQRASTDYFFSSSPSALAFFLDLPPTEALR